MHVKETFKGTGSFPIKLDGLGSLKALNAELEEGQELSKNGKKPKKEKPERYTGLSELEKDALER